MTIYDKGKHKPESEPEPDKNNNGNNGDSHPGGGYGLPPTREPRFKKSMETKFTKEWGTNKVGSIAKANITDKKTKYLRLGYTQNKRKVEMAKCGAATTKKRGPPAMDTTLEKERSHSLPQKRSYAYADVCTWKTNSLGL